MSQARYVVLGLAPARQQWFRDVSSWSTSGLLPIEFVKCVSVEELRVRLGRARSISAVLIDGEQPDVDRDLLARARDLSGVVLTIGTPSGHGALRDETWLPQPLDPADLLEALRQAQPIDDVAHQVHADVGPTRIPGPTFHEATLITALGVPGAGTSTVAMALAHGLGVASSHGAVLLADLALDADQALLHDAGDIVPGIQELIDAFRTGHPDHAELRTYLTDLPDRSYRLLIGLRRRRDWVTIKPRALAAALDALRRPHECIVADAGGDLDGFETCGSPHEEDRNRLARTAALDADLVLAVSRADLRGLGRLTRLIDDLSTLGVARARIQPVLNSAPRSPRHRAQLVAALAALVGGHRDESPVRPPLQLPSRPDLAGRVRDGPPPPAALVDPLHRATRLALDELPHRWLDGTTAQAPSPIAPGSLGLWTEEAAG